jgi:hypothetical protein
VCLHVVLLLHVCDHLVGGILHLPTYASGMVKSGWIWMVACRVCYILLLRVMSLSLHDCCQQQFADVCCKGNGDKLCRFQSGDCLLVDLYIGACLTRLSPLGLCTAVTGGH